MRLKTKSQCQCLSRQCHSQAHPKMLGREAAHPNPLFPFRMLDHPLREGVGTLVGEKDFMAVHGVINRKKEREVKMEKERDILVLGTQEDEEKVFKGVTFVGEMGIFNMIALIARL